MTMLLGLFDNIGLGIWGTLGIVLCALGAWNMVYSFKQNKWSFFFGATPLVFMGAWITERVRGIVDGRVTLPSSWFLLVTLSSLSIFALWLTHCNLYWNSTHITPLSIQEGFEKLTEGLCYFRDGGHCILVNSNMHQICKLMTGHMLLNGEEFADRIFGAASERFVGISSEETTEIQIVTLSNGQVKEFSRRKVPFEKNFVWEIMALDVTELYGKTIQLQAETERLKHFQMQLSDYTKEMKETVHQEEILQAKMRIHDEMNRLLLTTRKAIHFGNEEEKRKVLQEWGSNALLLGRESQKISSKEEAYRDLHTIAHSLGIQLRLENDMTDDPKKEVLSMLVLVAREAIVNAVKHAQAKELVVKFWKQEKEGVIWRHILFENEIERHKEGEQVLESGGRTISEKGGLKNIRQKLEAVGGGIKIERRPFGKDGLSEKGGEVFRLEIWFPEK